VSDLVSVVESSPNHASADRDFYSDLMGVPDRIRVYRLLVSGHSQAQAAKVLKLDKRAVHSMKNRLVRDRWLVEVEPRSYPRFYRPGPHGPPLMESPRDDVTRPLPPGVRLRYHNAAFGLSVEPPLPALEGWRHWAAAKAGRAPMAATTYLRKGEPYTVVLRGSRQPTLVVHLPPVYAYSAEELVTVAHDAPRRARDVAVSVAAAAGIKLRQRAVFSVQTPEIALEDPYGYVGSFWTDRSEGFHEWETGALLLGYFAAKLLEEKRLSVKSNPDVTSESNPDTTCASVRA
jgi:hypothetical protein